MINTGLFTSNSNEWATPIALFAELDSEFHFDLDPCATPENAKCSEFYTIENDGLTKNWGGGGKCFAIPLMERKSKNGFANVGKNRKNPIRWSLC